MQTKSILLLFCCAIIFVACSKDKFNSKPQLSFKAVSATTINSGDFLQFQLKVTDKEGDIQDTIWIQRNSKICPTSFASLLPYRVPDFVAPTNLDATMEITFIYKAFQQGVVQITGCSSPSRNDTSVFKFWLKDKKGNISDTISSPPIALLR